MTLWERIALAVLAIIGAVLSVLINCGEALHDLLP